MIELNSIPIDFLPLVAGIWGAIASAAGSVISGIMGKDAQEDATEAQLQAQRESIEEQRRQFDKIMELNQPIHESNLRARQAQEDLLGLGGMGGGQVGHSGVGGSGTKLPNRQGNRLSGTMPQRRAPNQFETPGSGVRTGTPGITAPEPGAMGSLGVNRFRGNRDRFAEGRINDLAGSQDNRQQFLLNQVRAGNIDPNNEFIQNILRNVGG